MKIHIVRKGDTLWELAQQYGVDFEALKAANSHISSPDMIMPGMKIRIPTSAKAVKKEAVVKEQQKEQIAEVPFKDITPKPMPVVQEDDIKPIMEIQPEMPMPQMPQLPQMTMPPVMQAPIMEQEQNMYMTFNFPESSEGHELPKVKHHKEKPKKEAMHQPIYHQPMVHQPMMQPVAMVPCFPVHPCHGMPFVHHPMPHPCHMAQPFFHPGQMMPMQDFKQDDCGCGGSQMPMPQMSDMAPMGFDYNMPFQGQQVPMQGQPMTFPTMDNLGGTGFPTPPGFGELRMESREESSN